MDVIAKLRGTNRLRLLHVKSNVFGALHWGNSIHVVDPPDEGDEDTYHYHYRTISDFLDAWDIIVSKQKTIRVPFLRHKYGLGTVAGAIFAFFHIYPHGDCGCGARKAWWNWLLAFIPWRYHGEEDANASK